MDQLDAFYNHARATIRRLEEEVSSLRSQMVAQREAYEKEISALQNSKNRGSDVQLASNVGATADPYVRYDNNEYPLSNDRLHENDISIDNDPNSLQLKKFKYKDHNVDTGLPIGNPAPQYDANFERMHEDLQMSPTPRRKRRKHQHIKQENDVGSGIPLLAHPLFEPHSLPPPPSFPQAGSPTCLQPSMHEPIDAEPAPASIIPPLVTPVLPPPLYTSPVKDLPTSRIPELEFARLPTQYSDSLFSPSQKISPIKKPVSNRSPSVEIKQEDEDVEEVISSSRSDSNVSSNKEDVLGDVEVIDDSQDEVELLRLPLKDITNTGDVLGGRSLKEINCKRSGETFEEKGKQMTILQRREFQRQELQIQLANEVFKVDLSRNPVYEQSWKLTDFEPNPNYIKPKLKRKKGKNSREQQDIDNFYKLAGPGIHLKSLKWNDEDISDLVRDETELHQDISQIYDRFPSPPGFNEIDFPTTQEEIERRKHAECIQQKRISSRLVQAIRSAQFPVGLKTGSYIFREKVIIEFIRLGRYIE